MDPGRNNHLKRVSWLDVISYALILLALTCFPLYLLFNSRWEPWPFDSVHDVGLPWLALLASLFVAVGTVARKLLRPDLPAKPSDVVLFTFAILVALGAFAMPGFVEATQRSRHVGCKQQLREIAGELEEHFASTGSLPDDLSGIGKAVEVADLYVTGSETVHWTKLSEKGGLLVSVGPDRINQFLLGGAKVPYDPTNGTFSIGDVLQEVEMDK